MIPRTAIIATACAVLPFSAVARPHDAAARDVQDNNPAAAKRDPVAAALVDHIRSAEEYVHTPPVPSSDLFNQDTCLLTRDLEPSRTPSSSRSPSPQPWTRLPAATTTPPPSPQTLRRHHHHHQLTATTTMKPTRQRARAPQATTALPATTAAAAAAAATAPPRQPVVAPPLGSPWSSVSRLSWFPAW